MNIEKHCIWTSISIVIPSCNSWRTTWFDCLSQIGDACNYWLNVGLGKRCFIFWLDYSSLLTHTFNMNCKPYSVIFCEHDKWLETVSSHCLTLKKSAFSKPVLSRHPYWMQGNVKLDKGQPCLRILSCDEILFRFFLPYLYMACHYKIWNKGDW